MIKRVAEMNLGFSSFDEFIMIQICRNFLKGNLNHILNYTRKVMKEY